MSRLIWSRRALGDLERLHAFLVEKDRDAARRAIRTIRTGLRLLARHPRAGRPVEAPLDDLREWPMRFGSGGYVALYRLDGEDVVILAVRHSREAGY